MQKDELVPSHFMDCGRDEGLVLAACSGLDHSASLKLARWHGSMDGASKTASTDYHTITHHNGGGTAHRMDRKAAPARARSITLMPDYAPSKWVSDHNLTFTHFYLDSAFVASIYAGMFGREMEPDAFLAVEGCPDVQTSDLLELCAYECLGDADIKQLKLDGWAVVLTEKILRTRSTYANAFVERAPHVLDGPRQADLVAFIEESLDENICLEQLSRVAGMNTYGFSRAFRAATGKSPYQYVLERRVVRARTLLEAGNDTIADIAYQCGFSSQQHMTNTFSKMLGVTPGKYRKDRLS